MATTAKGLRYPVATDPLNQGATAIQNLATDVDARLPAQTVYATAAVLASVPIAAAATFGTVTVSWPASRFTQPPVPLTQLVSSAGAATKATVLVTAVTATSVTVRLDLAAAAASAVSYGVYVLGVQMLSGASVG